MRTEHLSQTLGTMDQMQSALDRLEARVEYQTGRIDALYALLEARGLLLLPVDAGKGDALFEEIAEIEDAPIAREVRARPQRCRARFRVGEATGV
jgi:hypothetical protein